MIERYTLPPFGDLWSEDNKFEHWRYVATLQVRARFGDRLADRLQKAPFPSADAIRLREQATQHDVVAFLDEWRSGLPDDLARLVHVGLTSSDLVDSTNALRMMESSHLIEVALEDLVRVCAEFSVKHFDVLRLGRTHGQPAEVTTLGYQFARQVGALLACHDRFGKSMEDVGLVKLSGAVGTFRFTTPEQEIRFARLMGPEYSAMEICGQRIPRDGYSRWVNEMAVIASVIEDIALQIRLGQQWEIGELFEGHGVDAVGSSAMPHKANPIRSESLAGLAKTVRAQVLPVMEGIPTWGERDISHSSVERTALQTAATLTYYMIASMTHILLNLQIDASRMLVNITSAHDLPRSSHLLVELTQRTTMSLIDARAMLKDMFAGNTVVVDRLLAMAPELEGRLRPEPSMDIEHARRLMEEVINVKRNA